MRELVQAPDLVPVVRSLVELLQYRTRQQPDRVAFVCLGDGETESGRLTFAQLDARARAIAMALRTRSSPGDRILLLLPTSLDYVSAFFGCLYAGAVAVTAYPPRANRPNPRLSSMAADSQAKLALTSSAILSASRSRGAAGDALDALQWLSVEALRGQACDWRAPDVGPESLALLQYTSGSTSAPKGVMVSHGNLLHNLRIIEQRTGLTTRDMAVSWLPLFHDLGLTMGVLEPLYCGHPVALMSPSAFVTSPARWVRAISYYGATVSGGTNFAFELCAERVSPGERPSLDLRAWRVAFAGAEPIRFASLERFARAFEPSGFRRRAFFPGYGLAEATLLVSGGPAETGLVTARVQRAALEQGRVVPLSPGEAGETTLVCSGCPTPGQRVLIVDPDTRERCEPDRIGEIWVSGPSVAQGYWKNSDATRETFRGRLAETREGPFLRTGDLGFFHNGALCVSGRLKDLLIINGQNVHPEDIEWTAQHSHPALAPGGGGACSLSGDDGEQLAIVHELRRTHRHVPAGEVIAAIRRTIAEEYELPVHVVALLDPGALPRTTSGKVQRYACRVGLEDGTLRAITVSRLDTPADRPASPGSPPRTTQEMALAGIWSGVLHVEHIGIDDNFFELGGNSLSGTQLVSRVRDLFRIDMPLSTLFEAPTIAGMARYLEQAPREPAALEAGVIGRVPREHPPPLSFAQRRLWLLDQLDPGSAAYNLPVALELRGRLDTTALERSLNALVHRHESLRTVFETRRERPVQVVLRDLTIPLPVRDYLEVDEARRGAVAASHAQDEARRPFDLTRGPLFRALLQRLAADHHVLVLTMHHIVSDGWSVGVLLRELEELYNALEGGRPPALSDPALQYADFAAWERRRLTGRVLANVLDYWKNQLEGERPPLELPADRPRPAMQTLRGAVVEFSLPVVLAETLRAWSRSEDVTLFMTLLAAFQALLRRYTGQDDISVGSLFANRTRSELEDIVGCFINPLVFRGQFDAGITAADLLRQVRSTTFGAHAHQDAPFELVVEALHVERDRSRNPLFQALFIFQNAPLAGPRMHGLEVAVRQVETGVAQVDLTLEMREDESGRLDARLEYNADLFEPATIERMAAHFLVLLEGMAASPDTAVDRLPLLTEAELRQLARWNQTRTDIRTDACVHRLIEEQVRRTPDAPAVMLEGVSLTYRELNRRANRVAHGLMRFGVRPETLVGLAMDRSPQMLVGLLGILKAGGAYLAIDPTYPRERVSFLLRDAGASLLLTEQRLAGTLARLWAPEVQVLAIDGSEFDLEGERDDNPSTSAGHETLAYVIYTSGSTGTPKGVAIEHRSLANVSQALGCAYALGPGDRLLQFASLTWDTSVEEIFPCLIHGSTLVLRTESMIDSAQTFFERCRDWSITVLTLATSYWHELALGLESEPESGTAIPTSVRLVAFGGEPALPERLEAWRRRFGPHVRFVNTYGVTEATAVSTAWDAATARGSADNWRTVPIGRPIANVQAWVLNAALEPVPFGVTGELYIGGLGVGRGYPNDPDLTARRFVSDPFAAEPGVRLYRTGDLARCSPDGAIECLGRLDAQLKVHGVRVEPGEVEAALSSHPSVEAAAVAARWLTAGRRELVAYFTVRPGATVTSADLMTFLRARLPSPMWPGAFVRLSRMPATPTGKIDRLSLPDPTEDHLAASEAWVAPRTPLEEALAEIWADVLGGAATGIHDDFFALGGHSLLATQIVARVREVLGVELSLRTVFEHPTIAGMADQVERLWHAGPTAPRPPMQPVPRDGPLPLSLSQERLWFIHQMAPESPAYNLVGALRLGGPLDTDALSLGLEQLLRRHEALRTTFALVDGEPAQVVADSVDASLRVVDLRHVPREDRDDELQALLNQEARRPFDVERGPLFRVVLFRLATDDHVLFTSSHHLIADAWSSGVMTRELLTLYDGARAGRVPLLPPQRIQYVDFAVWQRRWLTGALVEGQLEYWRNRLSDLAPLALPTDRPRPAVQTYRGSYRMRPLPPALLDGLRSLSRREGVTLFMTTLAAFDALLFRYSGQEDIAVGTPIANRKWLAVEDLVGTFVNSLVMRTRVQGASPFRELLGHVREVALEAYAHQDVSFATLVAGLQPPRETSHSPLFQVMFNLVNVPTPPLRPAGLTCRYVDVDRGAAQFDLNFTVVDTPDLQRVAVEYNTDLFDADTAGRMLDHYMTLLEAIVEDPDQHVADLPLLSVAERAQLVETWNQTRADYPRDRGVHELVEAQAMRTPDRTAVVARSIRSGGQRSVSYRELNALSDSVARHLADLGIRPGVLVGIAVERSIEMVVGLLAILKAGGAYVPLDPCYPEERLRLMLEDTSVSVIVTQRSLQRVLPRSDARPVYLVDAGDEGDSSATVLPTMGRTNRTAYVLFTSGSTGRPKGVQVSHRALTNLLVAMQREPGLGEDDRLLAITTLSFDIAALELLLPLITGAQVIVAGRDVATDGRRLADALAAGGATVMQATPATWRMLVDAGWQGTPGLKILCGGERFPPDLADALLDRGASVWNLYGPTETTVWSSVQEVRRGEPIHLGRPIANTRLYVVDARGNPVPIGVPGELAIGGDGVAEGYFNRPDLTAERFLPDPFAGRPGARMYRSGDRARRRSDGTLEFLGRLDQQVKVRGFRVELGEIESALSQHPAVREAVAVARDAESGDTRVEAYVVPSGTAVLSNADLRAFLKDRLPDYMLPAAFVILDALPLTPARKIDRSALPRAEGERPPVVDRAVAPRDELEVRLVRLWERVLGVRPVGLLDDFFELGGHSLLVVRLFAELEQALGRRLPLETIFEAPTVDALAGILRRDGWSPSWQSLVALQPSGVRPPFFCIHEFDGNVFYYRELASHLGPDQPFFGLRAQGLDGEQPLQTTIEGMAAQYLEEIRTVQPEGPYCLGGSSLGGLVAYEMAQQLHSRGERVAMLALFDTFSPGYLRLVSLPLHYRISRHRHALARLSAGARVHYVLRRLRPRLDLIARVRNTIAAIRWDLQTLKAEAYRVRGWALTPALRDNLIRRTMIAAQVRYTPKPYPGRVTFFHAAEHEEQYYHDPFLDREAIENAGFLRGADLEELWPEIYKLGWDHLAQGGLEVHEAPGLHGLMVRDTFARTLADRLRKCLDKAMASEAPEHHPPNSN